MSALTGLKDMILNMLAPIIKKVAKDVLKTLIARFFEKAPNETKVVLMAAYPGIDVYLEDVVEKTKTELDDAVVEALMEAMEEEATNHGLILPNLDND